MVELTVLGVDPAFNRTGWAFVRGGGRRPQLVASGVVKPQPGSRPERLATIASTFERVLDDTGPDAVFIEQPGTWARRGGTRRETTEVLGMARGVLLLACARAGRSVSEVSFRTVRHSLLGDATASKVAVQQFLEGQGFVVPCRPRGRVDFDVADALLVALFGLHAARNGASDDC